jgi:hypothetical protein
MCVHEVIVVVLVVMAVVAMVLGVGEILHP